ncbi:MAG: hypothetical protein V1918_06125 [Planctomycetota bacterium]
MIPNSSEGSTGLPTLAIILVVIAFTVIFPYILYRTRRRTREGTTPVRKQWGAFEQASEARRGADRILVELVETSREISGRMDTKIRVLNTLLRDAERCIARLEELQGLPPSHSPQPFPPASATEESSPAHPSPSGRPPLLSTLPLFPASPPPDNKTGIQSGKGAPEQQEASPLPDRKDAAGDPTWEETLARRVTALTEQGYSVPEIARQVGLTRQEVALIRHLHAHGTEA